MSFYNELVRREYILQKDIGKTERKIKRSRMEKTCQQCGKEFHPYRAVEHTARFCSQKCCGQSKK